MVHDKLNGLVIRAPTAGKVSAIDLKVGEIRSAGQRLAEVTPQTGMKLNADIDEFYLTRVRVGQIATITVNGESVPLTIKRVYPQVQNGSVSSRSRFSGREPADARRGCDCPRPLAIRRRVRKGPSSLLGPSLNAQAGIGSLFSDPGATLLSAVASRWAVVRVSKWRSWRGSALVSE